MKKNRPTIGKHHTLFKVSMAVSLMLPMLLLAACGKTDAEAVPDEPQVSVSTDVSVEPVVHDESGKTAGQVESVDIPLLAGPEEAEEPERAAEPEKAPEPEEPAEPDVTVNADEPAKAVIEGELADLCEQVVSQTVTDDMNDREKAYAVYKWVESNIRYRGVSDKSDPEKGAISALSTYSGDCYAFCTASWALLSYLGFDTVIVNERGETHFWVMVRVDGNWYHFDTTTGWGGERFLLTNDELLAYSYKNPKYDEPLVYSWDPADGPATP